MNHWNRIFWAFFIFIGFVIVFGTLFRLLYLELLLGLIVIILGIQKLGEETHSNDFMNSQQKMNRNMDYLVHWTNATYDYIRNIKQKHEYRLYHLDKKRAEMEQKLEDSYRDFARKLFELENRMNELARAGLIAERPEIRSGRGTSPKTNVSMVAMPGEIRVERPAERKPEPKPVPENRLVDLSKRQRGGIKIIRNRGKISTKEYSRLFKVSDRTAQNDLRDMINKGLVKRVGEGANTHYELAF